MVSKDNSPKMLLLVIAASLISFSSFAQVKFPDRTFNFLQAIAFESNYENIIPMFQAMKLELEEKKVNKDKTEQFIFNIGESKSIKLLYAENKKFIYARIIYYKYNINEFQANIVDMFSEAGFVRSTDEQANIGKPLIAHFSKKDYPYEYITVKSFNSLKEIYIFNKAFGAVSKYFEKSIWGD